MDLYPDVMLAHGMIKPSGVCQRILSGLTRWGFGSDRCASVLSIGPDMANRVRPYLKQNEDTPWVPLWSSGSVSIPKQDEISHLRKSRGWNEGDLVIMYSGNMGLGHLFDEILEVASKVESGKLKAESGKWKVGNGEVWKSGERESGGGRQEAGPEEGVQNSKLNTQHSKLRLAFFGGGKRRSSRSSDPISFR